MLPLMPTLAATSSFETLEFLCSSHTLFCFNFSSRCWTGFSSLSFVIYVVVMKGVPVKTILTKDSVQFTGEYTRDYTEDIQLL